MDLSEQSKNWVTHQGHLHEASSCSWQRVRPVPTDAGFYRISDGDELASAPAKWVARRLDTCLTAHLGPLS